MADPTAPAVTERRDVFTDYVLSEPSWLAHTAVEEELNRDYKAEYVAVALRADPGRFDQAMEAAEKKVEKRPFAAMSDGYYAQIIKRLDALTPFLVLSCLKRHHPTITLARVNELLTDLRFVPAQQAALDLFGFRPKKAGDVDNPETGAAAESPSTSPTSPESSAAAA